MSKIQGLNLGSGGTEWNAPRGWEGLDALTGMLLSEATVFPYKDESVENVYSCHFFEHVNNTAALNLFKESYRVLNHGGTLRVAVPDFTKFIEKYKENDLGWYTDTVNFSGRSDWSHYDVDGGDIMNLMLHFVANYDFDGPNGFYRGGPRGLSKEKVREMANTLAVGEFCEWVQTHIPIGDKRVTTGHINWWTAEKLIAYISDAGFDTVEESRHGCTNSPEMGGDRFDSWKSFRAPFTLYVEAVK